MNHARPKILYVLNARFPTKRAYGIQAAKMCEAFIEQEVELKLLVPGTQASRDNKSVCEFYGLRVEVPMKRLANPDWYDGGRLGYRISSLIFMVSSFAYAIAARVRRRVDIVYTVDVDGFSHTFLPLAGPTVAEMHSPKRSGLLSRFFFRRVKGVVATNALIAGELQKTFGTKSLVEPNGVDPSTPMLARDEARRRLSLPQGETLALYVGRLLPWKGLEVLPKAAALVHGVSFRVLGGTREEFTQVFGDAGALEFAETKPADVPLWLAAADVLLVIGTRRDAYSYRYTTPMKVFEYLAAGRPVVASDTPALRSFVPADAVVYCMSDDPTALAAALEQALTNPPDPARGAALAREHTWARRAERIAQKFLQ